jgi:MFS family permease
MRLIESLLCIDYYEAHDRSIIDQYGKNIPERLCKANEIQVEVGRMIGLMLFFLMIGAIIVTVPLGHLADTRGRKWCLFNNALTWAFFGSLQLFICTRFPKITSECERSILTAIDLTYPLLPIWTLYFSGAFALIGGNFDIGVAILFSSVADVVPSNTQRTALFFIISSMMYVAQAIFAPIGGWLLDLDGEGGTPWVPYVIGISSEIGLAVLIAVAYPETLSKSPTPQHNSNLQSSSHESLKEHNILLKAKKQLSRIIYHKWKELEDIVQGIGVGSMLLLGLLMLFVTTGTKACDWYALVQYPIMKLGWKYSQVFSRASIYEASH